MEIQEVSLECYRGDTYTRTLEFTDELGNPINITGWKLFFTLKKDKRGIAEITGDQSAFTGQAGDKIKVTIDSVVYDDIDIAACVSIDDVVTAINSATGGSQASKNGDGYLVITSTTQGADSNCTIDDGTGSGQTVVAELFSVAESRTNTEGAQFKKDWTSHLEPLLGTTIFSLTAAQTDALAGSYHYDLQYKKSDDTIKTIMLGIFDFIEDITRRIS